MLLEPENRSTLIEEIALDLLALVKLLPKRMSTKSNCTGRMGILEWGLRTGNTANCPASAPDDSKDANQSRLEVVHGARRIAEAVLIVRRGQWVSVPGQYPINFYWPDGKMVGKLDIESATKRHGERVLSATQIRTGCRA